MHHTTECVSVSSFHLEDSLYLENFCPLNTYVIKWATPWFKELHIISCMPLQKLSNLHIIDF